MQGKEFIPLAIKTESTDFEAITSRLAVHENIRLLHGAIGLATEAGEIQDQLKRHIFYGKALDKTNLKEEVGDVLWYLAVTLHALNYTFEEAMDMVIAKLKERFGEKFSEEKALNRNLAVEREILEKHE